VICWPARTSREVQASGFEAHTRITEGKDDSHGTTLQKLQGSVHQVRRGRPQERGQEGRSQGALPQVVEGAQALHEAEEELSH